MVTYLLEIAMGLCLLLAVVAYAAIAVWLTVARWRSTHLAPVSLTRK